MRTRLFIFMMVYSGCLFSQTNLDLPVTIRFENKLLSEALYSIIDETDIDISFSNSILPKEKRVSVRVVDVPLKKLLSQILEGTGLTYRLLGEQIIVFKRVDLPKKKYKISGYIRDESNGERIIGATVYDKEKRKYTFTNEHGFFSFYLKEGHTNLEISSLGYEADTLRFNIKGDNFLELSLGPTFLAEVIVRAKDSTIVGTRLGNIDINLEQASQLPGLGGEADVLRLAYTLPGFQAGADGFGGISVRGGNVDQNLFLLDGVPVYNASHGIGIFSVYNSSAIRSAKVLKGAFPAKYGGRLSSVWDIQTKDGNSNNFQGEFDLGLSSGKLTLEGPINKGKGSVFFSGRRAFFDFWSGAVTKRLRKDGGVEGSLRYHFYDLNLKVNHQVSKKDHLYFSYYRGRDFFHDIRKPNSVFEDSITYILDEESLNWGNTIASLRWNHHFSDKLFGSTTISSSQYIYESQDVLDLEVVVGDSSVVRDVFVQKYNSEIEDKAIKIDFDYIAFKGHQIEFGGGVTWHQFRTGIANFQEAQGIDSIEIDTLGDWDRLPFKSVEMDAYFQDEIRFNDFVTLNLGVRLSGMKVQGKLYISPQPRVNLEIYPSKKLKFHLSANRMTQFLHLLSPSSLGLPKDLWVTSTELIPPQQAWQFQIGSERKFPKGFRVSFDGYYRDLSNLLVFKGSSVEDVNSTNWQSKVAIGDGRAYGTEFLLLRETPRYGGWIGYSLAWSDRLFSEGDVNKGNRYPIRLDRRHSFNLQFLYKFSKKWSGSLGYVYSSGTAFNFPSQQYQIIQPPDGPPTEIEIPPVSVIDELNDRRMPDYHRLDIAFNRVYWHGDTRHSFKIGFYNIYNRKNPLYFTLRDKFDENNVLTTEVIQVSLLPIFPTLRYTLELR